MPLRPIVQDPGGVSVLDDSGNTRSWTRVYSSFATPKAKHLLRTLLLALTPAMLCFTPICAPFLSLNHRFLYHQDGSASTVLLALLANIGVVWLGFAILFEVAERVSFLRVAIWSILALFLPWLLLRAYSALMYKTLPPGLVRGARLTAVLLLVVEALLWKRLVRPHFARILSAVQRLTLLSSVGWLITLAQLCSYAVTTGALNAPPTLHRSTMAGAEAARPRIVWIILDELGYDPAFAHRLPGLQLPAFDALAGQSTLFTQAIAPGLYTEQVVPALLVGSPVPFVALNASGQFFFRKAQSAPWQTLAETGTIFGDALGRNYTTAAIGWHNPYCRLLAPSLDHCFFSSRANSVTPDFDTQRSFRFNLLAPARHLLRNLREQDPYRTADAQEASAHIQDLERLVGATDAQIHAGTADFLFIHLPIPHPSGIYSRARSAFDTSGRTSYVDNLALADRVLAHLRDELKAAGTWDSSVVVLMGDHSWRTIQQWEPTRSWTAEDQLASDGGGYDPRPAYLVKLPGQQTAAQVNQPFPTIRTRALLDVIMAGTVRTSDDLARWVARQPIVTSRVR